MKRTDFAFIIITTIALLATSQVWAAVKVEPAEPVETDETKVETKAAPAGPGERLVAFRTTANNYITADPSNALDLAGVKIGSKQTFTLIDITGGELTDGHEIKIRYTPHTGKSSYWLETKGVIRRGREGDVFKIKRVDTKVALMTPAGRFVAPPTVPNALGLSDKQEGALLVEIIDPAKKVSILKPAAQPAPAPPETASPASTPPSTPEKPEAAP